MAISDLRIHLGNLRRFFARFDQIIAITGSVGKSSTTGMIGALMKSQGPTLVGQHFNEHRAMVLTLSKSWRPKKYWVQEVSGDAPGVVLKAAKFLRPTVAVITCVESDHIDNFNSQDEIAFEKGQLVAALPNTGLAVLNADDSRVIAMRSRCNCKVITFGYSEDADIRAVSWREGLPDRLTVTIMEGQQTYQVHTKLAAGRWITSILATIALGRGLGISLEQCADAISEMEPFLYRDSVHTLPDGSTMVLDTHKRAFWTVPSSIDIVRKASAPRKTMVFGSIGYYLGNEIEMYQSIAKDALEVCDRAIIYGDRDEKVLGLLAEYSGRLFHFSTILEVNEFLEKTAQSGELIYVKAAVADNFERLWYQRVEPIECWRNHCGKAKTCDRCKYLYGNR